MKIVEKNAGTKIDFEVSGTKITFADELMLNLAKLQKDEPEHKDICFDDDGDLVIGTASGKWYVAEVDIPAKEYEEHETEGEDGEKGIQMVAKPLNMDDVTLTLSVSAAAQAVLKALAFLPASATASEYEDDHMWMNNGADERAFYSGGRWISGASAGLFALHGYSPRSDSNWNIGFRSAYVDLPTE